eukprot:2331697-Amphidinium_carterae.1
MGAIPLAVRGGTTTSVTFDLELVLAFVVPLACTIPMIRSATLVPSKAIEGASKNNISRCRFAVLRDSHCLQEEWFDVSAK